MSDYLWDKTGEADDETRRLEELLGGFKFESRPLELPARTAPSLGAALKRTRLSWPRLAVAASLAAALLLGTWLLIAERRATKSDARQLAEAAGATADKYQPDIMPKGGDGQMPKAADDKTPEAAADGKTRKVGEDNKTPKAGEDGGDNKRPQLIDNPAGTPREVETVKGPKPRRPDLAGRRFTGTPRANRIETAKYKTPRATPEPREPAARKFTREEIAAAEKVMFALRLTGEKLAYARQQVQDAGRREANR